MSRLPTVLLLLLACAIGLALIARGARSEHWPTILAGAGLAVVSWCAVRYFGTAT